MEQTMGEIIRRLRRERDLTQEELAEQIGVTSQAVSKWENNTGMPDISQIVPLANLFGVSTDTLFHYCSADRKREIEGYREKSLGLRNRGEIAENLALWREAVKQFPGSYECMIGLAYALDATLYQEEFEERVEDYAKECVRLCEKILSDCTDSHIREDAIVTLTYLYCNTNLSVASEEKAVTYAKMAGSLWASSEILLEAAHFHGSESSDRIKSENRLALMDHICLGITWLHTDSEEEALQNCRAALTLWNTLIDDGNFYFFHGRISDIYRRMARSYAKLGQRDQTLDALERAAAHAKARDTLPEGEHPYTSRYVKGAVFDRSKSTKNYKESEFELLLERMKDGRFDFVRDDPRFQAILQG